MQKHIRFLPTRHRNQRTIFVGVACPPTTLYNQLIIQSLLCPQVLDKLPLMLTVFRQHGPAWETEENLHLSPDQSSRLHCTFQHLIFSRHGDTSSGNLHVEKNTQTHNNYRVPPGSTHRGIITVPHTCMWPVCTQYCWCAESNVTIPLLLALLYLWCIVDRKLIRGLSI